MTTDSPRDTTTDVPPSGGGDRPWRELLDHLPQTVFEFDMQGRFTYVNRTGLETFGYSQEDVRRGVSAFTMVVPEERELMRANVTARLTGVPFPRRGYTALRRDGSTFPALIHASVFLENGRPAGMVGHLIDVSERAQAEAALRYRIKFEQLIMEVSTQLISGLSPSELDERIGHALEAITRFLDVDRGYIFLTAPDGHLIDNTHEWVMPGISPQQTSMQRIDFEVTFPWFTEEMRRKRMVAVPEVASLPPEARCEQAEFERQGIQALVAVAMAHGGTVAGFLGFDAVRRTRSWSDDETAVLRILAEILTGSLMRKRAAEALQESERKYRALVETTSTGFVILDGQGTVLDANAEYVRMVGHTALDEIRARRVAEWVAPHDRERSAQAMRECLEQGFVRDLQIDHIRGDGTVVPALINATMTEVEGAQQMICLIRDMTERKRLENQVLRSEKLRSIGVLAGGIAHDFNNILTAILGNISLLRATIEGDTSSQELLAEAEKAALRAGDLTRQLLTFSRGGEPVRKLFAPAPVVRDTAVLALRGSATACELRLAPDLWSLMADEAQIVQVLSNLVINASQAMAGAGVIVLAAGNQRVGTGEIPSLRAGDYVVLSVSDRGPGIVAADRARIFDPYFSTKAEGRGLGLAICYSVVVNHGGTIVVDSEVGRGATFTVYLPAVTDAAAAIQAAQQPGLATGAGRVLVMDDEEAVRKVAQKMISKMGYQVESVRDGREAISQWQRARDEGRPFDIVIMDLTVPGGMGGREAVRQLLALDPRAKAVASSGYSQDPIMADHREYGFCDCIAKPYTAAEMSRTLAALLRER